MKLTRWLLVFVLSKAKSTPTSTYDKIKGQIIAHEAK